MMPISVSEESGVGQILPEIAPPTNAIQKIESGYLFLVGMVLDERLLDLLEKWEQRHQAGEDCTPEDLWQDCPELLDAFRTHLRHLQRADRFCASPTCPQVSEDSTIPALGCGRKWRRRRRPPLPHPKPLD